MPKVVLTPTWTSGVKTPLHANEALRTDVEVQGDGRNGIVVFSMTTGDVHLECAVTPEEWNAMAHAVDALLYDVDTRKEKP